MKLLFSSAVFVAILASASSIEDRAAVKGQHLAPRDVHTSTSWLLKQIAENIAVKKGGEDGDESETDDEPKTEDKPKTDDEPEEPKTDDEPEEPKTDDQPESDDQPEADDEPEEEPVKEDVRTFNPQFRLTVEINALTHPSYRMTRQMTRIRKMM